MKAITRLLVALVLACAHAVSAQTPLRVYFFDIGQGDAVLIQSPGGQNVLYDGGDSPSRIMAHLDALGIAQIDLIVASHNHADHIGGLAEVVRRFGPKYYMDNGVPTTTLTYRRVLEAVHLAGAQLLEPTDRRILLSGGALLRVLPPPGIAAWDQNDNAVGLIVEYGQFRLSMGGDAEQREWAWWMEHSADLLGPVQVHKASHHGSNNGDSVTALARLSPEVVIVSAGLANGYGHPRPEALRLYAQQGSTTFRTDLNGTVLVEGEASGQYRIRVERGQAAQPLPASTATR